MLLKIRQFVLTRKLEELCVILYAVPAIIIA